MLTVILDGQTGIMARELDVLCATVLVKIPVAEDETVSSLVARCGEVS